MVNITEGIPSEIYIAIGRGEYDDKGEYTLARDVTHVMLAEIERLRDTINSWEECGDRIMAAIGKPGPLADSDVIGEIERLTAIVDSLPMCWRLNEAGELVQDVPVVPGMNVWIRYTGGVGGVRETIVRRIRWTVQCTAIEMPGAVDRAPDELFNSREAAEAAKERE